MMISQRLWLMGLDDARGLPRVTIAPHVIATGLLLDLESAGLVEWHDNDQILLTQSTSTDDPLFQWALSQLDFLADGASSRFAMNALVSKAWERVGRSLTEAGITTCRTSRWRRNRYQLVESDARTRVVNEARQLLFSNTKESLADPCLAVLSACSVGEEFLSLSPTSDFEVARCFGSRPDNSPVEQRVWQCVSSTAVRAVGTSFVQPVTPGS